MKDCHWILDTCCKVLLPDELTNPTCRHLPYLSNMGTAISVMLLSDRMQGMQRVVSRASPSALTGATGEVPPVLLMEQRPQVLPRS